MSRIQTLVNNPDGSIRGVNMARIAEIPYFLTVNAVAGQPLVGQTLAITLAAWAANGVATFTTGTNHNLAIGRLIQVTGMNPAGFNGVFVVTSTPSATTFTVLMPVNPGAFVAGGLVLLYVRGAPISAGQSTPAPSIMGVSGEGPALIFGFAIQRIGPALVLLQLQDGPNVRSLMNQPIHVDTIFGNYTPGNPGGKSYPLPEALYLDETHNLAATFFDLSGAQNLVNPSLETQRFLTRRVMADINKIRNREQQRQYLTLPYWYTFDAGFSALAAGVGNLNTEVITIGPDHHFELMQLSAVSDGEFRLNIVDLVTGESLIDAPQGQNYGISSNLITGTGSFPFRFHEPRFFEVKTKIQITIENRIAGANTVRLTLGGRALADRMWV